MGTWTSGCERVVSAVTRKIPLRGRGRLARIIAKYAPDEVLDVLTILPRFRTRFYLRPREFVEYNLHYFGVWEPVETNFLRKLLRPGQVVFDIGANIGYYSVLASLLVGPSGKVYAFEPIRESHDRLVKNITVNHLRNVQAEPLALSDREGEVAMYLNPRFNSGGNSFFEHPDWNKTELVSTTTLDGFILRNNIPRVDMLKIDVEGAEFKVISGGTLLLAGENAPDLMMELNPELLANGGVSAQILLARLHEFGYATFHISRKGLYQIHNWDKPYMINIYATKSNVPVTG